MPSSAFIEWLETFKEWDADELTDHIEALKSQISIFSSQGVGSKNFTRDLGELRVQLSAATRAKKEQGQVNVTKSGVTDFSRVNAEADSGRGSQVGPSDI